MDGNRSRRRLFAALATGVSLLITLVLLEITSQLLDYWGYVEIGPPPAPCHADSAFPERCDEVLGWRLRPGVYEGGRIQINKLGFRSSIDFDFTASTGSSKSRVLLLGDSMVFGAGADQQSIFSEVMNRESRFEVINTGVIGYGTGQEYLVQNKYSALIQPDVAVLFYTEANDLWWNARTDGLNAGFSVQDGRLIYHPPQLDGGIPLSQRMAFGRLLDSVLLGRDLRYVKDRLSFAMFSEHSNTWVVTKRLLMEIKSAADRYHYPLIIFDIPTPRQLDNPDASRTRQALLARLSRDLGVTHVDLLDYYPKDSSRLHFAGDSHWNAEGHRFIARLLTSVLEQHRLRRREPSSS